MHTQLLATSTCKHNNAWIYYFSVFLQSVGYGLPICHFSPSQLENIQKPMTPVILSKLGICQNTSCKLCFLSSYYGGLDLRDLYVEQGIGQLQFIIRHLCSPGMVGSLLFTVLGWFQYNAGVSYCIMTNPSPHLPHLEGRWLLSVRDFLRSIHGSLQFTDAQIQPPQRLRDSYLMDIALGAQFSKPALRGINLCRMFFNATTISDITNASGTMLAPGIQYGTLHLYQSKPIGPKVKQPSPDPRSWSHWRKLLRLFSSLDGTLYANSCLGHWTVSGPTLRRQWPYYFSRSKNLLYRPTQSHFNAHQRVRHGIYSFQHLETHDALPTDALPVDCSNRRDGYCPRNIPSAPEDTIIFETCWDDYVLALPEWETMLLRRTHLRGHSPHELFHLLSNTPTATLVSDGAADHLQGAAGWVIAIGSNRVATGTLPVAGFDPRSYRAEGYGMLGGLLFLHHLCLYCDHLNTIALTNIFCDNLGLVKKINKLCSFRLAAASSALHSEYDVLAAIKALLTGFPLPPAIEHVKGHQDDKIKYRHLPLAAQLNCDANVLATRELSEYPTSIERVPILPAAKVQLSLGGRTVTRNLPATIRRQHGLRLLKTYLHQRFRWRNETIESVRWEAFSSAFRARYKFKTFNFKFCFKLLPTGKTLFTRTSRYDPRCPACHHEDECNHHLFQCKAVSRRRWQTTCLKAVRTQAESIKTDPKLVHILLAGLRSYFDGNDLPLEEFSKYPDEYHSLIESQEAIGWEHLLRCRFSLLWGDLQQDFMHRAHPSIKFDYDKWYRKLLSPLLTECHSLWLLRNGKRHGTEQQQKRTRRIKQLERDLNNLFKYKSTVLASDRDIFSTPVSDLIALPPSDIEKWIKSRKPIILHSRREAIKCSITCIRLLPTYFPTLPRRKPRRPTRRFPSPSSSPSPHTLINQHMTKHFAILPLVRLKRTNPKVTPYQPVHRTLAQQPLQFGDSPT